ELGTEASALVLEALIERRDAHRAPTLVLFMRPRHRIVLAVGLQRARQHPLAIAVNVAEAPDIDRPEVHGRLAGGDPLGQRAPGAAGAGDAEGVEAGAHVEVSHFRRLAEDEVAVRRE